MKVDVAACRDRALANNNREIGKLRGKQKENKKTLKGY